MKVDISNSKKRIKQNRIVNYAIMSMQKKSVKIIFPLIFAIALTLIVFSIIMPLFQLIETYLTKVIVDVVTKRGPIQYLSFFFFWFVIGKIILSWVRLNFEQKAFQDINQKFELKEGKAWSDAELIIKNLHGQIEIEYHNSILFKRIKEGLFRIKNTQDTNALVEYFKLRSELEYIEMESEFTEIKYYNWLIPILGFIGTVLGIGVGIRGFADLVIQSEGFDDVINYLPNVTHNLGVAFDTTLLALVLSAIGIFFSSVLTKKYSKLLESIDSYCFDDISGKFKLYSTLADQLQKVFRIMIEDITASMQADTLEIKNEVKYQFDVVKDQFNNVKEQLDIANEKFGKGLAILAVIANKIPNTQPINDLIEEMAKNINVLRELSEQKENDCETEESNKKVQEND